ncbi:MAG: hypothetical protein EAZ55_12240 [Cytophagales bacterium]|nr:MAG: hypothetical protein EAZ55_12240 [Cytophagales bacterium]
MKYFATQSCLVLFFCISFSVQGQIKLNGIGEITRYDNIAKQTYGLQLEIYPAEWISLGYQFSLGQSSENDIFGNYGHMTMGVYGASFPFRTYINTEEDFFLYVAVLAALLPESITFHIPITSSFYISPYAAPFGIEYMRLDGEDYYKGSFTGGVRLNIYYNGINFMPYMGARTTYDNPNWGIMLGASIGVIF